jgi:hypothetical protein
MRLAVMSVVTPELSQSHAELKPAKANKAASRIQISANKIIEKRLATDAAIAQQAPAGALCPFSDEQT